MSHKPDTLKIFGLRVAFLLLYPQNSNKLLSFMQNNVLKKNAQIRASNIQRKFKKHTTAPAFIVTHIVFALDECNEDEHQCDTDLCVPKAQVCDRHKDCVDGTDELNCVDVDDSHAAPSEREGM